MKVGVTPLMILTFGLLLLPVILTWATVRRKGCEVDRQAHQKAREYLVKALTP